jgi:beta-catenin-like protein 1
VTADNTREKLLAKTRAIKVLSYAMQGVEGSANCEKFVEVLGLKTFFPAFMGKVSFLFHSAWSKLTT